MTTATKDISAILDSIPRRDQKEVNAGQKCSPFLPESVDVGAKKLIEQDGRPRAALPRLTDIYRACVDRGVDILKAMPTDDVITAHKALTEPSRQAQCGFSKDVDLDLLLLRHKAGLFDYQIRRLALKLGFKAIFG